MVRTVGMDVELGIGSHDDDGKTFGHCFKKVAEDTPTGGGKGVCVYVHVHTHGRLPSPFAVRDSVFLRCDVRAWSYVVRWAVWLAAVNLV